MLAATIAGLSVVAPAPAVAIPAGEAITHLNAQRARNGLPAGIVEHPAKTLGCAQHLRYQQLNRTGLTHVEIEGRPGWTLEGAREAPGSGGSEVLGFGDAWDDAWTQPWSDAPIHFALTMSPEVQGAGYAFNGAATCMRLGEAPDGVVAIEPLPAIYSVPGPGVTGVPASWSTNELPYTPADVLGLREPTGYDILLWNRLTGADDIASAQLTGPAGPVAVRWVDSRTPTPTVTNGADTWEGGTWGWGTMVLPVRPLDPDQPYVLQVTFVDGTPYQLAFRTAPLPKPRVQQLSLHRASLAVRVDRDTSATIRVQKLSPTNPSRSIATVRRFEVDLDAGTTLRLRMRPLAAGRYRARVESDSGEVLAQTATLRVF